MKPGPKPKPTASYIKSTDRGGNLLDATTFRLRPSFNQWFWITTARCITLATLITAVIFGSTGKVFGISVQSIFGASIDADTQLAVIGFVNKILDVLVQKSLEESALVCLTLWMTAAKSHGVHREDFQLKDELTKPWFAVWIFAKRLRLHGWRSRIWPDSGRLVITLATSVSVILLAVAINTLGPPKLRWYPDIRNSTAGESEYLSINHPRLIFLALDWSNVWNQAFAITGGGSPSWAATDALITASAFTALSGLSSVFQNEPRGWRPNSNEILKLTALNTAMNGPVIQSLSVQSWIIPHMFEQQRNTGPGYIRRSIGFTGKLTVTLPSLTTSCTTTNVSQNPDESFAIHSPGANNATAFDLTLSSSRISNMSAMACHFQFTQTLYPLSVWIVNNAPADVSVNDYDHNFDHTITPLPSTGLDASITQGLSLRLAAVLESFNRIMINTTTADVLGLSARNLRTVHYGKLTSDEAAMAPVVALVAQHLLGIANWSISADSDTLVTSRPMQYQVYGAGPRLSWEWATVVVVAIIMMTQLYGLFCTIRHRIAPAPWLELGGMLVAANAAPRMKALDDALDEKERERALSRCRVLARDVSGVAQLTDTSNAVGAGVLDRSKRYRYIEDRKTKDWQL